ncbi:DAK2 domain-containing protein [Fundicoccus sp. Sow4_F4]|uniref:DAK2 domain-containing protein n=1 Tax=Fundicoccus sp. Sow4_F4 TaxID=3438783 RepID=UPI003F8E20B8
MDQGLNHQEYQRFKMAFQVGAEQVIAHKKELNAINVFPVSDGDTGSNLASLMQTIVEQTGEQLPSTLAFFERVADASLIGARGNSGIILAQYFNGLYVNLMKESESDIVQNFAKSAKLAIKDAYQAIEKPVEGTMITVIRLWGEALESQQAETPLEIRLAKALEVAKDALDKTTEQLQILRKNQVVDSGAKGFYLFIRGFTQSFNRQEIPELIVSDEPSMTREFHQRQLVSEAPQQRYCTEVLLDQVKVSKEVIQSALSSLGDSMVVVVSRGKARVHIHSNQPSKVLDILSSYGQPIQQKADDMLLQYQVRKSPKAKIALVTDSIADIPADYLLSQQIHVLPIMISIGEGSYLDRLTIQNKQFFTLQQELGERGSSSQPSLHQTETLFNFLDNHYDQVVVVTVSKELSGTYQSVKRLAEKILPSDRVKVIDSRQNSAAQGLMVMRVNQWIQEGLSFETISQKVDNLSEQVGILVSVDDLEPMIQSGRVPQAIGRMAQKLQLKPLVSLEQGQGKLSNFSFSQAGNERKMLKKIKAYHKQNLLLNYAIVYAGSSDRAEQWQAELTTKLGFKPSFVMLISTAVALSAGDGSVAIGFEFKEGVMFK